MTEHQPSCIVLTPFERAVLTCNNSFWENPFQPRTTTHPSYTTCIRINLFVNCLHPGRKTERKRPCSGRGEGRLFAEEPSLKVNKNIALSSIPVVLLRSTNQHIQPGLTRGEESACRPPACVHNMSVAFYCTVSIKFVLRLDLVYLCAIICYQMGESRFAYIFRGMWFTLRYHYWNDYFRNITNNCTDKCNS